MYGMDKNKIHFKVCFDEFLNFISNRKQLYAQVLFHDKIANHEESACIGSSFMGYGNSETGLQKVTETLKYLDYLVNQCSCQ